METALSEAAYEIANDDDNFDDLNDAYESGANIHGDQAPDPPVRFASIRFFHYISFCLFMHRIYIRATRPALLPSFLLKEP